VPAQEDGLVARGKRTIEALQNGSATARGEFEAILPGLSAIAESGDAVAQEVLGGYYLEYGNSPELAYGYFKRAADSGNPAGQRGLGHMLVNGIFVERDSVAAAAMFRSSADNGDMFAAFNLAQMLLRGVGVEADIAEGLRRLEEAANGGIAAAWTALAGWRAGEGDAVAARKFYALGSGAGDPKAMAILADYCRDGRGGEKDVLEAVRWYLRLLDFGNGDGVHEAIQLARSMTDEQIVRAAQLAGRASDAQALIQVARK
jgi:TPR repeat protein